MIIDKLIVLGDVKEFLVSSVFILVVFAYLNLKIRQPSQFSINISVLENGGPIWHSASGNGVHVIRVWYL